MEQPFVIQNRTFSYPGSGHPALLDVSFTVQKGEFLTLFGPSGCGKSTLLRQLKPALCPHGTVSGEIFFEGRPIESLTLREQSKEIGFVSQDPDAQIVTDKVWHELAFGLESLGVPSSQIRLRVAEMASFFGIQAWFHKPVSELSGGQKQMLNLASVMAMQPSVLLLDEPTSQLDPIAAADFLGALGRLNRELGVTILLSEHRLEEALPLSHRCLVLEQGRLVAAGPPREVGQRMGQSENALFQAMPTPMRVYQRVPNDLPCPITAGEGRIWLTDFAKEHPLRQDIFQENGDGDSRGKDAAPALSMQDIWFRYEKEGPDILKGLSLTVPKGALFAVVGGNGTGKTTALSILSGQNQPHRGKVRIFGKTRAEYEKEAPEGRLVALPQDPKVLFVKKTVREELLDMLPPRGLHPAAGAKRVEAVAALCGLDTLLDRHPYDLSGGEQQRAALAKVLLREPEILLLDEPTKGLDAGFKQSFAKILACLQRAGVTIVMVSHDIEFCAQYATRCALFFDGGVVSEGPPRAFFAGNRFYTTSANRMARHLLPQAVTAEDVIFACGGVPPSQGDGGGALQSWPPWPEGDEAEGAPPAQDEAEQREKRVRPVWQMLLAVAALCGFLVTGYFALLEFGGFGGIRQFLSGGNGAIQMAQENGWVYTGFLLALLGEAGVFFFAVLRGRKGRPSPLVTDDKALPPVRRRTLSKRTVFAVVVVLLAIPLTIFIGIYYLGDRKYVFISILLLVEAMLPFALMFEGRRPQARELIVIAVLCALGVAGRMAFFMLPQFKPVAALVILSGVCFGGETGFLVGALTAFVSNMFMGQGPWTPWQMFAFGLIGALAGVLFRKGRLPRNRLSLCLYGGISVFCIYGGVINPASVLMFQPHPSYEMVLLSYLQGVPFDLIHAASTVFFLYLIAMPMVEKLERVRMKYGMIAG